MACRTSWGIMIMPVKKLQNLWECEDRMASHPPTKVNTVKFCFKFYCYGNTMKDPFQNVSQPPPSIYFWIRRIIFVVILPIEYQYLETVGSKVFITICDWI